MASVACGGTADWITARIFFKVVRAGSGTPARYSSTLFGVALPFAGKPFFFLIGSLYYGQPLYCRTCRVPHFSRSVREVGLVCSLVTDDVWIRSSYSTV